MTLNSTQPVILSIHRIASGMRIDFFCPLCPGKMWREIRLHQLRSSLLFSFPVSGFFPIKNQAETLPPAVQFHYSICIAVQPCSDGMQLLRLPMNVEEVRLVFIHFLSFMSHSKTFWVQWSQEKAACGMWALISLCAQRRAVVILMNRSLGWCSKVGGYSASSDTTCLQSFFCDRDQKLSYVIYFLHLIKIFLSFMKPNREKCVKIYIKI